MAQALILDSCIQRNTLTPLVIENLSATCHSHTVKMGPRSKAFGPFVSSARYEGNATSCKWALSVNSRRAPCSGLMTGKKDSVSSRVRIVCTANSTDGIKVNQVEKVEDTISTLLDANRKLLERIAELETTVRQLKAEAGNGGANESLVANTFEISSSTGDLAVLESKELSEYSSLIRNIEWPSPDDDVPFWKRARKMDKSSDSNRKDIEGRGNHSPQDSNSVYVVHMTAEMAPMAKVGGLGDVVTGLARACLERGHKVLVVLPFYECIDTQQVEDLKEAESFNSYHRGSWTHVKTFKGNVTGVPVLLLQPSNQFFKGPSMYGGAYDELEAYLFFCRASLERFQVTGDQPDIIHIHEWQLGAVAMLYWDIYNKLSLQKPRIVLTIHNMEHYGECRLEQIAMCGLDGRVYSTIDRAIDERTIGHNPERLSLLKGGIVYSNAVTTVSPTYASETLCSGWMANTLLKHRSKYFGILNGIDTTLWDPANDPFLPMGFSAKNLMGKQVCKQYIQRGLGLEPDDFLGESDSLSERKCSPLAICITRLVAQKGIHLIRHAIHTMGNMGGQVVLLGTAPDPRLQAEFESLARQFSNSKNVRLLLFYSEELAHMLYAAADIVLVPSMFEPCGLTQMIGMRYGAIPVVRRTGGLADTVFDVDDRAKASVANGFVFDGISEDAFGITLNRAISYYQRREWWQDLTSRAMEVDSSWDKSAQEYLGLYNSIRVRV